MQEKEIREIRRRFRNGKSSITTIKGCIIDKEKNIKTYINQSLINTVSDDANKLLSIMKKTLSGTIGTNLIDIEYKAMEVMDNTAHSLLMDLRNSHLQNEELLNIFYSKIAESVTIEDEYAILLANDNYDVFSYNESGEKEEDSSTVFSYIVCCICPIKNSKQAIYFNDFDSSFRMTDAHLLLQNPDFGFMFPSFDDRAANIYKVQFYTKDISNIHSDFIRNIFNIDSPISASEQKENFITCLSESLLEECNLNVLRSVHDQISEMVTEHKETKQEEPLLLTKSTFKNILTDCGIVEDKINDFSTKFEEQFGENAQLTPNSIINTKKFEVNTPYVTINVDPQRSDLISTEIINGSRYILVRANDGVEVNGINIDI